MSPGTNSHYTTICILLSWFWGFCYGFVLLSSATGAGGVPLNNVFQPGQAWVYEYQTRILLNEKGQQEKDVGFLVGGKLLVESVWANTDLGRVLRFQIQTQKLFIRSRNSQATDGFVNHKSKIDTLPKNSFYVLWTKGSIQKIIVLKDQPVTLTNLQKGFASLFQFQLLDIEVNETDASGNCKSTYTSLSSTKSQKTKSACLSPDLPYQNNPELILAVKVNSARTTIYDFDESHSYIKEITSSESHSGFTAVKEDVGNQVDVFQKLVLTSSTTSSTRLALTSFSEALKAINSHEKSEFDEDTLITEREDLQDGSVTFSGTINEFRENLKNELLGGLNPAKVLPRLISIGRTANKADISKALSSKKNIPILPQLYDILGYLQHEDGHAVAMKKLKFDDSTQHDLCERYLWALSISSQPSPEILSDLLHKYQKGTSIPDKLRETLLLTIASMANHLAKLPHYNHKVYNNVEEALLHGLEHVQKEDRFAYLRALKNLRSVNTLAALINVIRKGTEKEGALAWKAIRAFEPSQWTPVILRTARKTFFQLDKRHDSSSRTLAADILLLSNPSKDTLKDFVYFLLSKDKAFEVKQYVVQLLRMLAEEDANLSNTISYILKSDPQLHNYHISAQRGLSTALSRDFLRSPSSNGSLLTIQEMFGGIVKRGIVNVMMEKGGVSKEIFSLGVFSGGLGGFISSGNADSDNEVDPDEVATAGMDITVLGNQIRPFTFFSGQGELMGHVWAGTASEKTTAFQALALLQDHQEYIRLGPGFISELDTKGATSFDLSGRIEFSLWNRNAFSLVEKSAGIVVLGRMSVDTSFVRSQVEFSLSIEPKLNLQTDIDFYSGVSLCMRLSQPNVAFRHNVFKIERIPGSKHRLRKVKYKKYIVPGRTYSLNRKNSDMCNVIFK